MTSLERVLTALGHKEPDRVPLFLLPTMHGAKELGMSIKEYFSNAENVFEGQLRLREKYGHDCISNFFYAAIEVEAAGADVIYSDNGPPNSGRPIISKPSDIESYTAPDIIESDCLAKILQTTEMLKAEAGEDAPVIGVAISPFSLPVMQMGFDKYIELIYDDRELFWQLMKINEEFCVDWANAQAEAGAAAICYFDPVSSVTIIPRELYLETGFKIAKQTISRIKAPIAAHFASGRCLPIIDDIAQTGTVIVGTSAEEDLVDLKNTCRGRLTVLGNLNGIEMSRWTPAQAEGAVKDAIKKAGPGGGFILADNHGEIPFQVSDKILKAVSDAVKKWGQYPLDWIDDIEK